jgi:FkbM family methyltransferase
MQSALQVGRKIAVQLRRLPGTYRIINFVRQRAYTAGDVIVDDFDRTLRMKVNLSEHMGSQIFWFGYYNRDLLMLMSRLLRPGMTFIDGGANIGEVTLFAAKRVGPTGRVISFEPLPRLAELCRANVKMNNFKFVSVEDLGLSDRPDRLPLYVAAAPDSDGSYNDGQGSLYRSDIRGVPTQTITVTTIDEYLTGSSIDRVDGIKLDIEGAELPALRGASRILDQCRPWLLIEIGRGTCEAAGYQSDDVFDFLSGYGYQFYTVARKGKLLPLQRHNLSWWQNIFCTRNTANDLEL